MKDNKLQQVKRVSKFLSMVLRHKPESIGVELDRYGWVDVDILLFKLNEHGKNVDFDTLTFVVENNNKKRFAFNDDQTKIRASQGHSIKVDLGYIPQTPPEILYHGTARITVDGIFKTGIEKRDRHHVHLSKDMETAVNVGQRHGKPVVFEVLALQMHNDGFSFYVSENGVWLTDNVPVKYLNLLESL